MKKAFYAGLLLMLVVGGSLAQSKAPAPNAADTPVVLATPTERGGVKGQNIFEVKPDASDEPAYAAQSNAERTKVQPGNNAPMWRQVGAGVTGYSSLPKSQAPEAGNLIQAFVQYPGARLTNAGEGWRQVRNQWIIPYGGAFLSISALALLNMLFAKGPMGHEHPESGLKIERFTPFERAVHWSNAFAFCALALSGLVMAFGKFVLLPVVGPTLFGWLTFFLKNVHNFTGPLFAVSLLIVVITFVKDNIAGMSDFIWLTTAGGLLGDKQVPSHRFNAAEKGLFWWAVTVPGLIAVGSGLVIDKLVPGLGDVRSEMQIALMIHAVVAIWMMALLIGHIYMGTVGVRGAYTAMKTGYVSEGWAKEHHELWLNDIKAGKIPAQRSQDSMIEPIANV